MGPFFEHMFSVGLDVFEEFVWMSTIEYGNNKEFEQISLLVSILKKINWMVLSQSD